MADEAKDGAEPKQELDPIRCGRRRSEGIGAILLLVLLCLGLSEATLNVLGFKPLQQHVDFNPVDVQPELLVEVVQILLLTLSAVAKLSEPPHLPEFFRAFIVLPQSCSCASGKFEFVVTRRNFPLSALDCRVTPSPRTRRT